MFVAMFAGAQPLVRLNVNLIQIDVTVTGKGGQRVPDLTTADFEIYQDGKRQSITQFSYVAAADGRAAAGAGRLSSPTTTAAINPHDVRRTMALVVDDLSISFESMAYVREALKKFIREQVRAGDLVAIVRTSSGAGAYQQFTADRDRLLAAADRVRFFLSPTTNVSSFQPLFQVPDVGGYQQARFDEMMRRQERMTRDLLGAQRDSSTAGMLGAINWVVQGLHALPGRKAAVLFSEELTMYQRASRPRTSQGFGPDDMGETLPRTVQALRSLTDLANRAGVVIYTIDPRGLVAGGMKASDVVAIPQQTLDDLQNRNDDYRASQQGMEALAEDTGGLFLSESNDLAGLLARAAADQDGYYLIGYAPDDDTFKKFESGPKFHKIEVKVKRAGVRARYRRGFFGMKDDERLSAPSEPVIAALMSPFTENGIRVKMTPSFQYNAAQGAHVSSLLFIDARDLQFRDELAEADDKDRTPWKVSDIQVVVVTFRENGSAEGQTGKNYSVRARGRTFDSLLANGLVQTVIHPLRNAGVFQLRAAVHDTATKKVGTAAQMIDAPDVAKKRFAMSGVTLASADWPRGGSLGSPATRVFHPGESVKYSAVVYNPAAGPSLKTALIRRVVVIREGKIVQAADPSFEPPESAATGSVVLSGVLALKPDLPPGEYEMHVLALDNAAGEKHGTASSVIGFEVRSKL